MKKLIDKDELLERLNVLLRFYEKSNFGDACFDDFNEDVREQVEACRIWGTYDETRKPTKPTKPTKSGYAAEADELHDDIYEAIGTLRTLAVLSYSEEVCDYIKDLRERLAYDLHMLMVAIEGQDDDK